MGPVALAEGEVAEDVARCVVRAADLFEDDLAFAPDFVFVEDREAHRIDQHVEPLAPGGGGQGRVVDGLIEDV